MKHQAQPIVSAVIPCYNHGQYVAAAIDSVLSSGYPEIEIIVVNDGSDDPGTINTLNKLATRSCVRVVSRKNGGISAARNTGIAQARGAFIITLDADDTIDPTFIEKALKRFSDNPSLGFVYSHVRMMGARTHVRRMPTYNFYKLLWDNVVPTCAVVRQEALLSVDGYDEAMRDGFEDWELWIRLGKAGWEGYRIDEPLYKYYIEQGTMMTKARDKRKKITTYMHKKHADLYKNRHRMAELRSTWLPNPLQFFRYRIKLWSKRAGRLMPHSVYKRLKHAYHTLRDVF